MGRITCGLPSSPEVGSDRIGECHDAQVWGAVCTCNHQDLTRSNGCRWVVLYHTNWKHSGC
jgi:hypothetical protein